ncbi:MAG: hypothetical protein NT098_03650 [Candidatus Parcubacteria bacterium]|nr:hypothetical protein [Candidatus Parcubacteria bacterium]
MFHFSYHHKKRKDSKENTRGFLMMYAILFITVVLTIAMGILDIALKQFSISSINRESSRALYAADAGLECVLYGDQFQQLFATTTDPDRTIIPINMGTTGLKKDASPVCANNSIDIYTPDTNPPARGKHSLVWSDYPYENGFKLTFGQGADLVCATVTVTKTLLPNGSLSQTTIDSRGYNTTCPPDQELRMPRVERGLTAFY